ncbi:hypothetical protein Tco_0236173 [Tanacetum coccineum]
MSEAENHPPASYVTALQIPIIKKGEHLLSFQMLRCQEFMAAIKARFGGNKESKKLQKNLLKQQFETFVIGAREELDSAYERFCVMSELKSASSSNSQSIAFMSAKIKGSTSRQYWVTLLGMQVCKYQANRANGSKEKRFVPIEDSNLKALVAKDSKDHVDIRQDGLGMFDWSEEVDTAPVTLALMATSSTDSSSSEGFGVEYSSSEESNNSSGDETLTGPLYENFKREKAYKAVPPPTGAIMPPRADVAFTGIDELAIRNKVINKEQTQNTVKSNIDRNKVIIEDWVDSDDEEVPLEVSENKKQTVLKSETSSENKSPRSEDSFGQRSRRRGLGYRNAVLTREGLKSTVRSKRTQAVPSQSTVSAFYQSTARPYFQKPVFSTSTGRPYYPRMDNVRPRSSSSSPTRFFNKRTVDRPKSPKPIIKSKWVKKESTARTQAVLPQTKGEKRRGNLEEELKDHAIIDNFCSGSMTGDKDKLLDFKDYKGGYVAFGNDPKGATTQIEAHKALRKDEEGEDVDVHLYRLMIGCLMYLTASRPDIMFAVCLCARFQVTPKVSHMHAVKRIFRYLKHQPKLGLWYLKDSPFHLEAFSDSDYVGDNHDRRSTSSGCQYLRRRLVQLFGSQYWNDEPIAMFKGRTACKVWTLKEDLMLFLRGVGFEGMLCTAEVHKGTDKAHEGTAEVHEGTAKVNEGTAEVIESTAEVIKGDAQVFEGTFEDFEGTTKVHKGTDKAHEGTTEVHKGTNKAHEGTAEVHEGTAKVNEGTAEVIESTAEVIEGTAKVNESTAGTNLSTEPSNDEVEDEAGPSTFQDESDEFIQDDTLIADLLVNISKSRRGAGITIPGNIPEQERSESPTQILDPKDKGKGIMKEEPKKKKLTLQQLRAAETANDEEFARRVAAKWENFTEEQKAKFLVETIAAQRRFRAEQQVALRRSKPPTIPQLRNQMMKYIRNVSGKAYKNLKNKSYEEIRDIYEKVKRFNDKFVAIGSTEDEQAIKEMNVKAEEPSKKRKGTIRKMKSSRIIKRRKIQKSDDELKDFLKVVDFEGDSAQDVEVMEQHSVISRFSIIQSPEGEYIAVQRANGHIRAFNTLNEVLHILDRQDLHHLHRLVIEYYEHIPPTGLGLILHGDLTTMMETTEESDDELWRNQTEWEIISWRFYESTGVHILELENGTMIHMLVEQRYPLTRELMQRMLEHKLEVQKETEDALNVIRFVMKQKEDLEREEE